MEAGPTLTSLQAAGATTDPFGRVEATVFEIFVGLGLLVLAALPKAKFYNSGAPGTKYGPPIEPSWIPRLLIMVAGLAAFLDGVWRIRHH